MKQSLLLFGGFTLFILTTLLIVFVPMELGVLNNSQKLFILMITILGYSSSLLYFYTWHTNSVKK